MAVLEWALVLLILFGGIAVSVGAIVGSLDAAEYPAEAWERAGYRRNRWVWQVFGVLCVPVALVYTGSYLARVRPRLMRAARDLAVERYVPGRGLAAAPDRFSQPVRLRTSWLAVALNGGPGVVMFGAFGVFALANGDTRLGPLMLVPGVAFTAGLAASNRLYGVTLGPGGIQMNGL
ncbi:MAG: hypothetical protein LBQ06_07635, partial [Frankiaceae bacterium]|nr:hypothetical protein [Frankiaceae bacterium]